jgi:hypothetical protein
LSVIMRFGAMPCFFKRRVNNPRAAWALRWRWTYPAKA